MDMHGVYELSRVAGGGRLRGWEVWRLESEILSTYSDQGRGFQTSGHFWIPKPSRLSVRCATLCPVLLLTHNALARKLCLQTCSPHAQTPSHARIHDANNKHTCMRRPSPAAGLCVRLLWCVSKVAAWVHKVREDAGPAE